MDYLYTLTEGSEEKIKKLAGFTDIRKYNLFRNGPITSDAFAELSGMGREAAYKFCEFSAKSYILKRVKDSDEEDIRKKMVDGDVQKLKNYILKTRCDENSNFGIIRSRELSKQTGISIYSIAHRMRNLEQEGIVTRGNDCKGKFYVVNHQILSPRLMSAP